MDKRYEEALERARQGLPIDEIFPELKDSDDERIRKNCIHFLELQKTHHADTFEIDDCIAYLERQKEQKPERINITEMVAKYRATDEYIEGEYKGKPLNCMIRAYEQGIYDTLLKVKEQKPAEWSEEDKEMVSSIKQWLDEVEPQYVEKEQSWLDTLPERFNLQPKQEWSEEDEKMLQALIHDLGVICEKVYPDNVNLKKELNWLKSLRPQPKQEWSEKEKGILLECISALRNSGNWLLADKLESFRPQPNTVSVENATKFGSLEYERGVKDGIQSEKSRHWKPSEGQIYAIVEALKYIPNNKEEWIILENLMNDLQKLL